MTLPPANWNGRCVSCGEVLGPVSWTPTGGDPHCAGCAGDSPKLEAQHRGLLAALQATLEQWWPRVEGCNEPDCWVCKQNTAVEKQARTAIQKAKSKTPL